MKIREYLYRKNEAVGLTDKEAKVADWLTCIAIIREEPEEAEKWRIPWQHLHLLDFHTCNKSKIRA